MPKPKAKASYRSALAGAAIALAVAGCQGTLQSASESVVASSSPTAAGSAQATRTSEASPTPAAPSFEAPPGVLPPLSRAVVILDGLRVREQPGLDAAVVTTLPADTVVDISGWFGPTVVDGIDWYSIQYGDHMPGYAAAASGDVRYLDLLPPRCKEGEPDLAGVLRLTGWERLACFSDRSLTLAGTYGCPVCGAFNPGTFEPRWLASPENLSFLGTGLNAYVMLHFPPAAGLESPLNSAILRVTGHFNDPASTTCVIGPSAGETGPTVDPEHAALYCREQFVVDSYEVIGADPEFSYPPIP